MTSRSDFLATVRAHLEPGNPTNPLRPLHEVPNGPIAYTGDLTDPVRAFRAALEAVAGRVVGEPTEVTSAIVDRVLADTGAASVAVSDDPVCEGIEEHLRDRGVTIVPAHDADALASADLGITGAIGAIALTGSVVVDSRSAGGRLVSLLPRVHLALIGQEAIVATPGELIRTLPGRYEDLDLPSNIVFITGPSRSADIELQLTLGVHGPHELLVAFRPD